MGSGTRQEAILGPLRVWTTRGRPEVFAVSKTVVSDTL